MWILTERAQRRLASYCSALIWALPAVRLTLCSLGSISSQITLSTSQLFSESCETWPAFPAAPGRTLAFLLHRGGGRACCLPVRTPFENNSPRSLLTLDPLQLQFTCVQSHSEVKGQGLQDKHGANNCASNSEWREKIKSAQSAAGEVQHLGTETEETENRESH